MRIPTLTTTRLTLRPFTAADVDPLHHILCEKGVLRYFPKPDPPARERVERLIAHQLEHWEKHGYGWWAVELRSQSGLIGWNGLQFLPETGEVEVGYLLAKALWGQGLATEGARASVQYGFEQLGLETIVGIVHPDNVASRHVLEKVGMAFTHRARYFGMGCFHYAIRRSSFGVNGRVLSG
jgi:RimJ/RimL family protein N-acetyltransferase